jgi:hypothetical protein
LQAYVAGTSQVSLDDLIQSLKEVDEKARQTQERRTAMSQLLNAEGLQQFEYRVPAVRVSCDC